MIPSREFMVRQAVLNAIWNEYPNLVAKADGIAGALWTLCIFSTSTEVPGNLIVAITREFHKLQNRYEVAA